MARGQTRITAFIAASGNRTTLWRLVHVVPTLQTKRSEPRERVASVLVFSLCDAARRAAQNQDRLSRKGFRTLVIKGMHDMELCALILDYAHKSR